MIWSKRRTFSFLMPYILTFEKTIIAAYLNRWIRRLFSVISAYYVPWETAVCPALLMLLTEVSKLSSYCTINFIQTLTKLYFMAGQNSPEILEMFSFKHTDNSISTEQTLQALEPGQALEITERSQEFNEWCRSRRKAILLFNCTVSLTDLL